MERELQSPERVYFEFFATCLAGFEAVLADELRLLRIRRVRPLAGGVAFSARAIDAERVCLFSRVASRVMCVLGRVNAGDAELLYAGVHDLAWEEILKPGASILVRAHGTNDELRNSQFTALKVKDALVDCLRVKTGERPDVDTQTPDAAIDVRVRGSKATISLDLSGSSLHKRTYFDEHDGADAPLACAQAAGMLAAAGARERFAAGWGFVDPACDEGFTVCEAAGMAADLAPGLLREHWGFFGWAHHDEAAWAELLATADERFERGLEALLGPDAARAVRETPSADAVRIVGLSASSPAIARARAHLRAAGLRGAASVELSALDENVATVERVARVAARAEEGAALVVAHAARTERADDARAVSEEAAVMQAVGASPAGSVFAFMGAGMRDRFGVEPVCSMAVGHARIESMLEVYDRPPAARATVRIPDAAGGADHFVEVCDAHVEQFAARLRKMAKERRKWAKREGVCCYRVYDADLSDYNVAIDVYVGAGESWGKTFVHVAEYKAPASVDAALARQRFNDVLAVVPVVLDVRPDHVFSKVRERSRGGSQYGARRRSYVAYTSEADQVLEIDLAGYLDTGVFLDHRTTRLMIGEMARGKSFLNLFAYTGVATVHAAASGASSTVTVDLSQTYLDWARRNMELNDLATPQDYFVRADVMGWIRDARRRGDRFDLIFVDPPTFSNSKAMGSRTWDVQRDHVELLIGVSRLLDRDGVAVFSCNLRSFKPDVEQLARYGVELEDITARTIPHDFERNPRIHRCFLVRAAR